MKLRLRRVGVFVTVCICMAVAANVSSVKADSSFALLSSGGIALNDSSPLPIGSLVQLIWSSDNMYASALEGKLDAAGLLEDGDYLLFSGNSTLIADGLGGWLGDLDGVSTYTGANVGGNLLPSGYVYGRVFNSLDTSAAAGSLYGLTPLISVLNQATNSPPDIPDAVDFAPNSAFVLNQTVGVIPEPASIALGVVGLGALLLRRRLSRR